jgi:hypothetical protein
LGTSRENSGVRSSAAIGLPNRCAAVTCADDVSPGPFVQPPRASPPRRAVSAAGQGRGSGTALDESPGWENTLCVNTPGHRSAAGAVTRCVPRDGRGQANADRFAATAGYGSRAPPGQSTRPSAEEIRDAIAPAGRLSQGATFRALLEISAPTSASSERMRDGT